MSWIICILFFLLSISLIAEMKFFSRDGISFQWLTITFMIKIATGIFFIWLYSHYYSNRSEADVYKYFDDGKVLFDVSHTSTKDFLILTSGIGGNIEELTQIHLHQSHFWDKSPSLPFFNDNRFIIRYNAVMMLFSGGNIYTHMVVAIFISFLGLFYLFKFFKKAIGENEKIIFLFVFFIPSLLLWTSSVLKESFLILGFGGFLWYMLEYMNNRFRSILLMLLFSFIIASSKMYVLLVLIPPTISFIWNKNKDDGKGWIRFILINLLFIGLILNIGLYFPKYDILSMLAFKQSEFKCLAEWTGAGSVVFIPDLTSNINSFIAAIPYALYNSLLRPMPWDKMNMLGVLAMLEIVGIVLFAVLGLTFKSASDTRNKNFILFSLNFIIIMSLLIGWTTPVIGAIVRYRIVVLPFLIMLILMIADIEKMIKFVGLKSLNK